jgi:hypothetical protein
MAHLFRASMRAITKKTQSDHIKILDCNFKQCDSRATPSESKFQEKFTAPEEASMSSKERRIAPRKACAIPIHFRSFTSEYVPAAVGVAASGGSSRQDRSVKAQPTYQETIVGETFNLSERGIGFKSPLNFSVGESVEMYFTLPRELTGRKPEEVRCNARVVHVDNKMDAQGMKAVGAEVERFEPLNVGRSWEN